MGENPRRYEDPQSETLAKLKQRPVSWSSSNAFVSGVGGLRLKSRGVKADTEFLMTRHRSNISSKRAVLPGRDVVEMGPANSLHTLA